MTFIANSQIQNPKEVKTVGKPREEPRIPSFYETPNLGKRKHSLRKTKGEKKVKNAKQKTLKQKRDSDTENDILQSNVEGYEAKIIIEDSDQEYGPDSEYELNDYM